MSKVLVTGGSGFIGTNLIESLVLNGYNVLNLDKNQPKNSVYSAYWKSIDILDRPELEKSVVEFEPDIIVHLAAVTDLNGTNIDYYAANILGTKHLINIAYNLPSLKKIIFTSSMYVCKPGYIPSDYNTYCPHTMYGESKVQGEQLVKNIKNTHYSWVIIRPTSIWGPWFGIPYIDFFETVYKGRYFDFGKACTKTYGYIENTVFQIKHLINNDNIHGKVFYLGDSPPIQISDWANEISIEFGKGQIKKIPYFLLKCVALWGDLLSKLGIKFPMTSFRLSNMTTNNILPVDDLNQIIGPLPISRIQGVFATIDWLRRYKNY